MQPHFPPPSPDPWQCDSPDGYSEGSSESTLEDLTPVTERRGPRVTPSIEPLLHYWRGLLELPDHPLRPLAEKLLAQVQQSPELLGLWTPELCQTHRALFEALLINTIPQALPRYVCSAVVNPFEFEVYYATPRFAQELLQNGKLRGRLELGGMDWHELGELFCFLLVARQLYGFTFDFKKSVVLENADPGTGLSRFWQLRFHADHIRLRVQEPLEPLTESEHEHLVQNLDNLEVWRSIVPCEKIEMFGLSVIDAVEITEEVSISAIKQELVATNSLRSRERMMQVQQHFRQLLGVPDLWLALGGKHGQQTLVFSQEWSDKQIEADWVDLPSVSAVLDPAETHRVTQTEGRLYTDLSREPSGALSLLEKLRELGQRSALLLPLRHNGEPLGFLLCSSGQPHAFTPLTMARIRPVETQMAWAVRRALNGIDTRVQAVLKERFTVLHPSIEWKFRQLALRIVQNEGGERIDDLVFPVVYALFGISDVRNSTVTRNTAIAADFKTQLLSCEKVLRKARASHPLTYLDNLIHRGRGWVARMDNGMTSEDESYVLDFFKTDVEPVFHSIAQFDPECSASVLDYRDGLDPLLGLVHQQRKRYEDSMALLQDCIAEILTRAQVDVQKGHPHYFELRKTDGVDHTIYTGPSIHPEGKFDPLFLKNLRLWQLEVMVDICRKCNRLLHRMPLALHCAHLILVQDSTLAIRFSDEEKQFSVDGAYNARYEILKKRIDKAEVKGTGERLTEPGKVAIVYTHPREAAEYRYFIEYLQSIGQLKPEIEELEIGPLQGVSGLRAIRVSTT